MAVYVWTGLGSFLVSLHQLAFAIDVGFEPLYAASVLGIGKLLAMGGTIGTGALSDYIGRERAAILAYGISILGVCGALSLANAQQTWLLWFHACCFGLTWGARGPAITAKTVDLFPGRQVGTILGVITIGTGVGSAVGSWASGSDFRSLRQLPPGLCPVHCVISWGLCRLLVLASSPGALAGAVASVPVR